MLSATTTKPGLWESVLYLHTGGFLVFSLGPHSCRVMGPFFLSQLHGLMCSAAPLPSVLLFFCLHSSKTDPLPHLNGPDPFSILLQYNENQRKGG